MGGPERRGAVDRNWPWISTGRQEAQGGVKDDSWVSDLWKGWILETEQWVKKDQVEEEWC